MACGATLDGRREWAAIVQLMAFGRHCSSAASRAFTVLVGCPPQRRGLRDRLGDGPYCGRRIAMVLALVDAGHQ